MKARFRRRAGWERALEDEIRRAALRPLWWGIDDCCLFAANVVRRMTGLDPAAAFRGRYRTARGAARAMRRILGADGVEAVAEIVAGVHRAPEIPVALAGRGDLVLADTPAGPALGVVDGSGRRFAAKHARGVSFHALPDARRAWRIG